MNWAMTMGKMAERVDSHESRIAWRRRFRIALAVCLMMLAAMIVQKIQYDKRQAIQNNKTAIVAAQAASISKVATVLVSEDGMVIRSNTWANEMFAAGSNMEGGNVHDYCVSPDKRAMAMQSIKRWYRSVPSGSVKLIAVDACLKSGTIPIIIIATTIQRDLGSDIAIRADIFPADKFSMTDINLPVSATLH